MGGLLGGEKKSENIFTHFEFDTIHDRDGQTDGQTPDDGIGRDCCSRAAKTITIIFKKYS